MKFFPISLLFILMVFSCQPKEQATNQADTTLTQANKTESPKAPAITPAPEQPTKPKTTDFSVKTKTGKTWHIKPSKEQGFTLTSEGFGFSEPLELSVKSITKVLSADIDHNGFGELYIISDTKPFVTAFVSYKDRSYGQVSVPRLPSNLRQGYAGKDNWAIQDDQLIRTFSLDDGTTRTLTYSLHAGEAGYSLLAKTR